MGHNFNKTIEINDQDYWNKFKKFILQVSGKKYLKQGNCVACGSCCTNISVKHGRKVIQTEEQFEALQRKFRVYRMFKIIDNTENGLVFQCVFLSDETKKCTNYENRPPICRNYPHEVIFRLGGNLAEGCGFYFKPLKSFKKVLSEAQKK